MDQTRVLIVVSDNGFALSIAAVLQESGFASTIALSAADAQRELRERRPDLIILRAELPDLSGFAFCGRLRKDKTAQGLPIVLMSSDATAEALAQHRSHPQSAADGYLQIPFPMEEILTQVQALLSLLGTGIIQMLPDDAHEQTRPDLQRPTFGGPADAQPASPSAVDDLEGALDGAFGLGGSAPRATAVEGEGVGNATSDPSAAIAGIEAMVPPPPPRPPRLPKRPRRSSVSDEDRQFLDRLFESIADRKAELLAESRSAARRPPVKRELLATPEGKLQILREELNRREAQVARLSEIWGIRERELSSIDDKLHEKEVEIQGLKMQVDDLMRRLSDARDLFIKKDQEHGAALDSMLLDKFVNEKELIEVVASKEKDVSLLRRDLHAREDELGRRNQELDQSREETLRLEKARQDEFDQYANHLHDLEGRLARREIEILGLNSDLEEAVRSAQMLGHELSDTRESLQRDHRQFARDLEASSAEHDFDVRALQGQVEAEKARVALAEIQLDEGKRAFELEAAALREDLQVAEEQLSEVQTERESLKVQRDGLSQSLSARLQESEAHVERLTQDLTQEHEQAVARDAQLSAELASKVEQLGNLEGELEALRADKEEREAELLGELGQTTERLEGANGEVAMLSKDLESARGRSEQLAEELDGLRRRTDGERQQAADAHAALEQDRDQQLAAAAEQLDQVRGELTEHIGRLTQDLARTARELAETQDAKEKREADLTAQLSEKIELAGSLEGELTATRAHAEEREEALSQEIAQLRAEAEALQEAFEKLGKRTRRGSRARCPRPDPGAQRARRSERDPDLVGMQTQRSELSAQLEAARGGAEVLGEQLETLLGRGDEVRGRRARRHPDRRPYGRAGRRPGPAGRGPRGAEPDPRGGRGVPRAGRGARRGAARRAGGPRASAAGGRGAGPGGDRGGPGPARGARGGRRGEGQGLGRGGSAGSRRCRPRSRSARRRSAARPRCAPTPRSRRRRSSRTSSGSSRPRPRPRKSSCRRCRPRSAGSRTRSGRASTSHAGGIPASPGEVREGSRQAQRREAQAALQAAGRQAERAVGRAAAVGAAGPAAPGGGGRRAGAEGRGPGQGARGQGRASARDPRARRARGPAGAAAAQQEGHRARAGARGRQRGQGPGREAISGGGAQAGRGASAQDLTQKLAAAQRVQKDLEARLQKEGAEQAQKLKAELERREAQRQQEVARLQQALQEKSKQLKVMELEVQRIKQKGGSPSSGSPLPSPGCAQVSASPSPAARKPPPPPPSIDPDITHDGSLDEPENPTQVMQRSRESRS